MKRLFAAAVLFAVILIICFTSHFAVRGSIRTAQAEIDKCKALYYAKDYTGTYTAVQTFSDNWHKSKMLISAFTNHRPLDDISMLAASIHAAVKAKNDFQFYYAVNQVIAQLEMIEHEHSLSFENMY